MTSYTLRSFSRVVIEREGYWIWQHYVFTASPCILWTLREECQKQSHQTVRNARVPYLQDRRQKDGGSVVRTTLLASLSSNSFHSPSAILCPSSTSCFTFLSSSYSFCSYFSTFILLPVVFYLPLTFSSFSSSCFFSPVLSVLFFFYIFFLISFTHADLVQSRKVKSRNKTRQQLLQVLHPKRNHMHTFVHGINANVLCELRYGQKLALKPWRADGGFREVQHQIHQNPSTEIAGLSRCVDGQTDTAS